MYGFIQLKNVKHRKSESDITPHYKATVYVDGERFARVSNTGGDTADTVELLDDFTDADLNRLQKRIAKEYPKIRFFGRSFSQDLESVCHGLLDENMHREDLKRGLEKDWVFILGDYSEVAGFKREKGQTADEVTKIVRLEVDRNAILLNDMPFEKALEEYLKCAAKVEEELA